MMRPFYRCLCLGALVCAGLLIGLRLSVRTVSAQAEVPPPPAEVTSALETGLQQAVLQRQDKALELVIYRVVVDHIVLSADGKQAVLWLALAERDSQHVIATEPALGIATLQGNDPSDAAAWQFTLPVDEDWPAQMAQLSPELITADQRESFLNTVAEQRAPQQVEAIPGYHLPWAAGRSKLLEGSIAHFKIYFSCRYDSDCYYAYDFADGTMFPLVAARGGTVYTYYDGCSNGNHDCSNYIVLKDTSTEPDTYQLYLHIAYNSVPARLRTIGASVLQGEYIANVDDTGYSTGHHLHFHVFSYFTTPYWGPSLDITFDEVAINGGRPRTCEEATRWPEYGTGCIPGDWYTSANAVPYPPSGGLTTPAAFAQVTNPNLVVNGWADDREGVNAIWVKGQWDGVWHTLAQPAQVNFSTSLNLCSLGVPNGPIDLALTIEDEEGNRIGGYGQRSLLINVTCPPDSPPQPACQPDDDEIAIYSDPNYQGTCLRMGGGSYNSPGEFGEIANNNIESVQVGANARTFLYHNGYFGGREETLEASDPNLADNRIQTNSVSSLIVTSDAAQPGAPVLTPISADATTSLVLAWRGNVDAPGVDYQAELFGPDNANLLAASRAYAPATSWSVGTLAAGDYVLVVTARNSAGTASGQTTLTINPASLPVQSTLGLPYSADFNASAADWHTDGTWQWVDQAWKFANGQTEGVVPGGDLTSPPILLPAAPASELRFRFFAGTEENAGFWDQMRVQIAPEGQPFVDFWQVTGQAQNLWLDSPALNLAAYAGQTVRIRFHFDAVDEYFNANAGWTVDDVRVQAAAAPLACAETMPNDTWQTAVAISAPTNGTICPNGDVDYYSFQGTAGGYLDLTASASGYAPRLTLLDNAGSLLLAGGSPLRMVLTRTGTYFVGVSAPQHPGQGGTAYAYTLNALVDTSPPQVTLTYPSDSITPDFPFLLRAQASDVGGVTSVAFYWHSNVWSSNWRLLGTDTYGVDGWSQSVDPAQMPGLFGGAFAVRAVDTSGYAGGSWRLNLIPDTIPPTVSWQPLASPYPGTAVDMHWNGSDTGVGVGHYELQYRQEPDGTWQTVNNAIPASNPQSFYVGQFGQNVGFRVRAIDLAGNVGNYQSISTTIESACLPDAREDGDDVPAGAAGLSSEPLSANLCGLNDADYYTISAAPGQPMLVLVNSLSGGAAVNIDLLQGAQVVAQASAGAVGEAAALRWWPQNDAPYTIKITPLAGVAGTQAIYSIRAFVPIDLYLPLISQ